MIWILDRKSFTICKKGIQRAAGEEWLVTELGAFLPGVDEKVIGLIDAFILTEKVSLHLKALQTFANCLNIQRRAGEKWLITKEDAASYIPGVHEIVVKEVNIIILSSREYCVVLDPWN